MKQMSHHLAAVWFVDVVGYSALSEEDEATALRLVRTFISSTRDAVERYGRRAAARGRAERSDFPMTRWSGTTTT